MRGASASGRASPSRAVVPTWWVRQRKIQARTTRLIAADGLLQRWFEILLTAQSCIHDFASRIEDDDVGRGGCVVRAARVALAVEQLSPGKLVLLDVRLHARRRLVDRDGHAEEFDAILVFRVERLERRLELVTVAAPRRPELHQHRFLANILRKVRGYSVERVQRGRGRRGSDLQPDFLRAERGRREDI